MTYQKRKPDPRDPGPAVDVERAEMARKLIGCDRVFVPNGNESTIVELEGSAYEHIGRLVGNSAPDGRYIEWDERSSTGVHVFYAPENEHRERATPFSVMLHAPLSTYWLTGPVVFAGRLSEGDIIGLSVAQIRMVEAGLLLAHQGL